jgi:hypothetical protein
MLFLILQRNKTFPELAKPLILFSEIMGINDIRLSPSLVAALYPESLVDGRDQVPPGKPAKPGLTSQTEESVYPFLGKNLQSICFLVSYPDDEFIPDEQLVFLMKILTACRFSLDDIALVNSKHRPVQMETLKNQFNPRIIFLWGTPSSIPDIDREFPDMIISSWQNISILPVSQPEIMSTDSPEGLAMKRNLWVSLKKLFKL